MDRGEKKKKEGKKKERRGGKSRVRGGEEREGLDFAHTCKNYCGRQRLRNPHIGNCISEIKFTVRVSRSSNMMTDFIVTRAVLVMAELLVSVLREVQAGAVWWRQRDRL